MKLKSSESVAIIGSAAVTASLAAWYLNRRRRSRWTKTEVEEKGALPSIFDSFKELELDYDTTVEEANKRRTASYYEKARQAHSNALVLGVVPHSHLKNMRLKEEERILSYWNRGDQSHRAIVVMCDPPTQRVLSLAREKILHPLGYSTDTDTSGAWIPKLSIIPEEDMHITVALPWWWHTIQPGDHELSKEMADRFRQTLLMEFHYPFQIELERFILLGGKILVALWRCVGERTTDDGTIIYDRHGENIDPFVRLREEIVRCFTTESLDSRLQPITYQDKNLSRSRATVIAPNARRRKHTIMQKTPGFGQKGKADGFIHTSLCRLPLDCMSSRDIDLGQIHRLCREATATFSGHRMAVSKYRFIESRGEGGESNPCVNPPFEEYIDAPTHRMVNIDGDVTEDSSTLNVRRKENIRFTIGSNQFGQKINNFRDDGL